MPIYKLNGDVYDIPQEKQGEFESQFPDAFISYTAGEDQYEIPVSKKNDFLRDFPDAQPYSISTPQVQETPIEDPAPMAEVPMFDDEPNAPLGESDAERGFGAGAREGWKGLKAGFQNLWGETANVFTGSSQDSINALNELNDIVRQGKDVAAETEDAWTDAGREIRTGAMEFLPGWMIKGWKDRVLARAEKEKVLDDIREALGEAGGDVDKARSILEQRAQEMSYGDEQIAEAAEKFADVKPTEGFGAWVGSNVVQMIPSASALIVGAVTKSPAAAKAIGMIGMGGMTAATAGTSMYEARQAGASDQKVWKVGITDGMIEYLTEKLPFDRYTSRIMGKVKGEVAQDLFSALRTNKATRTELEKLLVKANERLGGRLFSKKNLKDYVADMLAEGASEFSAEALQTMTSMMYENPEDYPTINEILTNGWEGAKAGFFMGAVLGGASKTMEHTQNRKRRMDKGSVDVALVDFGDGEKDVAEVVEYDASSNTAVVLHDGSFEKVSGDAIADGYRFSYEEFENARLRQMEDEAVVSGNVTEGQIQGLEDNIARDIDEIKALAPEMTESEISAVLQSEMAVDPDTPLGEAVAKYQEDVARHGELVAAKREADAAKKEAIRTEIETAVGQRFWVQESGEDDGSGIVPVSETVEEVVYADGRVGYVVGSDESGNLTMVYTDGTKGFSSRAEITEKENSGEVLSNTVMGLDDYLAVKMDIDEVTREKARMQEEHALSVEEMVATHPQGSVINVGTEEAKIEVPVIAPPTKDGVIVQMPDGTTPMLTWEDVAHAEKKEITPKTNAQLNQSIVDEYRVAYTPAAPAASQPAQQKEEQVKRTSPANPLPLKADGSVDQTALWNKDPEGWAKWNDEKRQDGGADSLAYVTNAIAIEQAKMAELQAVRSQETDFDRRDALDAEIATAQERIDRLVAIQQGYLAQPAVADAVQNVQPEPEPQTEEERAAAEEQRREPFRKRAKELGEKLGVKINIAESLADVQEEQAREEIIGAEVSGSGARFPGWYNRDTGEVTIYLPHVRGVADIDRTIIHEVVAHKGLRGLLGKEGYNVLCDAVWDMMTEAERAKYMAYPGVNGDKRLAADEYIARFAEGLDLEQSRPIWNKIAEAVQKILNSMGIRLEVTKEDLADLIAASYMRLQEQARAAQTENAPVVEEAAEEVVPETTIEQQAETGADVEADIEEVTEESTSPIIAAAQQDKGGISFNVTTEEPLQDKIRKFAQTEEGKATGWTEDDIESIIAETESLIDAIHRSSTGNEFYDEFAYKEPTIRVDWRDGEAKPIVTWTRANIEYKYDMSADLLCINNEGLEKVLSSDKMVALMEMFVPEKKAKKGEPEIKFTSEDYLELYNTLKDLGFVVPCKGCFDAAGRFKMLPSVAQKFAAEVNAIIDERNKDPKAFDEKLKAKPGDKTVGGLPATAATKSAAIAAGVAGDNLTEHVKWTQLMSADGQTKMLSDWGGIFRAWQRTGAGRPKDKLLPEPYYGDIVSSVSTIIGKYGEKTPSFRDTLVNQGTGLRRNSHSEFRPVLAIDEIQFMRDAFIRNLTVFKYMKELDDVRLFGKMGVKFNMSFFPEYVPGTKVAGLDKDGNYIASEESVGSREFPYQGEDGKRHYDGMKGWEEAQKHINKDVSLSSVIFSIPHLLKALTDVPTPSDMRGIWGSLIPFHSSGATTASLAMQGLGMARANGVGHGFSEAFYDYGKGVTNFEAVQNDRFGEGWHIVSGTKAGTDVEPGHKLEFVNGNHYYNKALGVHLFASGYILDSELPAGVLGENGELDITNDQKKDLMHKFTIDYNDKVRELKGPYAYKVAADFYIAELPKLGLIPRFDFEVSEEKFLEMCEAANVDPRHPKLGWKGEGNSWSPIDSEAYYSLFCDYGMTDPATGEWAPHMPVGYVNEKGEREFRLPDNAVEIVKEGLDRFSEVRRSENARIDEAIEAFAERSVEKGRISQESVDKVLGKEPAPKKSGVIDLVEEAKKAVEKESGLSFRMTRTDEQRERLFGKAKERFGLTNNFNAAGYMLPDGSLLDFSEANDGGDPNQRSLDHREIEGIIMDEGKEYDSRWMYLADFMNEGAIRLLPEYAGINLMKAPTKEQRQKLFDFIYKYNGEVILEIADERLNNVAYVEYDRRTSPSRIFRDIDRYFNEGIVPQQSGISFRAVNDNQAIFVSNAAKAVEGIKQEKATPEQWLKMIEKNGGLKAGEDKWMGLSDWLKASDKKTLTKDEVLEFIGEHMIQIEEQHYDIDAEDDAERAHSEITEKLQDRFDHYEDEYYQEQDWDGETEDARAYAIEKLREEMGDTFPYTIELEYGNVYLTFPYEEEDDLVVWAQKTGVEYTPGVAPINETRLDYTTDGLENKHEIALTVPTIERWGQHDDIHFGDAGDGRAVAWIRFGETEVTEQQSDNTKELQKQHDEALKRFKAASAANFEMSKESEKAWKEDGGYSWSDNRMPEEWQERRRKVVAELRESMKELNRLGVALDEKEGDVVKKVLVIDEIQSKRHQEGRERGYMTKEARAEFDSHIDVVKKTQDALLAHIEKLVEKYPNTDYDINDVFKNYGAFSAEDKAELTRLKAEYDSERDKGAELVGRQSRLIPDAPFDKNWHELAMKRMLRYAAEEGYDVIAWTKGDQQAERYNLSKQINSISRKDSEGFTGRRFVLRGPEAHIRFVVNDEGIVTYASNSNEGDKPLSDYVGKELAVKMMALNNGDSLGETEIAIGGEGMKGFYDKMLPAFMNKYGKKWGVKVEDIELPNLEEAGRVMHSVPVTEEMKASVMGGQVMFRMRTEEEDAMEFAQSAIDDCLSRYNDVAEVKVFPVNEETAERFGYTLEELKKTGGEYLEDEDLIAIFANEDYDDSAIFENIFFHESIHKIASFFTEFVEIGEWLWSNAGEVGLQAVKTHIEENYKPSQYNEEMLTFGMSLAMSIGVAGKQEKAIPQIYRSAYRKILNEIGYEPEKESRRAEERISDSSRKEAHRNERKADEGGRGKEGETRTAELSTAERRVIGEYFPEFNKEEKEGVSFRTSLELDEEFGDAWRNQQNEDGRHSTQVANTKSTYEKIGHYLEDAGMKGASILDASSGLGLGTQALREMGFKVDDVEPFPSENREAPTFSSYADIDKQYDVVISNAVLNVIPDDWRADVLHQMADAVKEGGKMIINTRPASNIAQQGVEGKTRITLDSPSEILVKRGDRIAAYQKGFTSEELAEWIKSELGEGWRVEKATKKNSGISGEGTAVVIKERGGVSFRTYEQEEFDDTNIKDALSELYDDLEFADNGIYGADDVASWINSILANYVGKYESDLQNIIDTYEDASVEFAADFRRYGGRMIDTEERDAEVASMLSNVIAAIDNEDNVSFRVTGTPTDEVVANGLTLSPAQTAEVAANIFAALPEESREKITDGLNGNILGLQDAIMQIPASLATKENWNEEDRAMADVVAEEMTKMAGEMTRPFSAPEALWLLYNNLNKGNDLISQASRALVQRNLGFDEETLERQEEAKQGVSFRMVGDATANAKASMYNRGAVNVWTRLKESFVDMQASVEELVNAIEKATGKVAKGFENILLALNQQSSKGLAAMESYEQRFLMPMFDEVRKIMDKAYAGYDTVVRYVILKHGLERNKKLAQRDAKAHYQEIYDEMIAKVNSMDDRQKRTYLTNAQLQDADAKAKLATLKAADTSAFTEEEKNAHKRELAKAKEEAKKAKENLERAQKINSMSEQELKDELDKVFEKIENGTDSVYKELRKNDYSGISSMFYDQLGVNRKDYSTEEEYQAALMLAKNDRFSSLEDIEEQAEGEVSSFEGRVDTKELWKRINAATKETLRQQYEANMISKDQYESLRNMFGYYVPLRGFKDNTAEDMYTYYRKPNSTGYTKPILGAEGRKTEAESPFGWIAAMAGSAIASNVKNEAKLALYYFVSNRPDNGIATLSRTWFVHTPGDVDANGKKIFKPAYPPFSEDLSSDAAKQAYEDWQEQMRELQKQGLAYEAGQRLNLGNAVVNISDANKPEHVVTVKVAGKDYTIVINGNPRAAQAINGELNLEGTADDYSAIFGPVLRWMSSVNTSYNPEFWITNLMRDMAFTWMAVNTKEDPVYRKKFSKNYWKCFRVIGLVAKNEKGTIGNSYIEDMYKDFVKYGGVTGYTQIKDSETWEKEIDNYLRSTSPESLKNGRMMRGMKTFFHAAHRFGESLEQVSRFAAFLTSREMGKTINEAIADAKEITVNFNRKGSGKMISLEESKYLTDKNGQPLSLPARWAAVGLSSIAPLGRRTIMFFNAAVQGLNSVYRLWKKNPRRLAGWTAAYFAIGVLNAVIHALLDDDDDYLDIPQYERRNSLMLGGNGAYLKWALPQEARAFYALGDLAVESVLGRNPHQNVVGEAMKIATEVLPVNPSEGWKAFVPSVAIPAVELMLNEDYKGAPIYNEQKWLSEEERKRTAKWSSAYQGTGAMYKGIAQGLNYVTGGDKHDAGKVNLQPEKMEHIVQSAFGGTIRTADKFINTIWAMFDPEEDVTVRQTPFLNRILTLNDERFKNVHVNEVFDYYKADADHALTLEKRYTKDRDLESLNELRKSEEYQWAKVYRRYKKALDNLKEKLKVAEGTAEKKELMRQQDELKRRVIKEISEL